MTFHYFGGLLWGALCRGPLLSNRVTFDYFSILFWGYFRKPSFRDSCLVTGPLFMTFHYFGGLLWEAFRRGQLLTDQATFDNVSLLWGITL